MEPVIFMNFFRIALVLLICFLSIQIAHAGWTKHDAGTLAWLHSVYFLDENRGWIGGTSGTFLVTRDGGLTWKTGGKFTEDTIRDVYFSDAQNGWLLCDRGIYNSDSPSYVLETADGGTTWQKTGFTGGRERIARLFFSKNGDAYAAGEGGVAFRQRSGRRKWERLALPVRYLILDGAFTGDLHAVMVGGGGTILLSGDGGSTWSPSKFLKANVKTRLTSVFFSDTKKGWSVGEEGKIFHTNDGGKLWREQNSGVAESLSDVYFIDSGEGFAIGENGLILHTKTAGESWTIERVNIKHKLEKLYFAGKRGFAVGFGGTILRYDRVP